MASFTEKFRNVTSNIPLSTNLHVLDVPGAALGLTFTCNRIIVVYNCTNMQQLMKRKMYGSVVLTAVWY